jgi:hypothetical protein
LPEALLTEVHVQVGGAVVGRGVRVPVIALRRRTERFLPQVRGVPHHRIEACVISPVRSLAVEEHFGKL